LFAQRKTSGAQAWFDPVARFARSGDAAGAIEVCAAAFAATREQAIFMSKGIKVGLRLIEVMA